MFYFNKTNPDVLFNDIKSANETLCDGRKLVVDPDCKHDFRNLPFGDKTFNLVIFDPPHLIWVGEKSWMFKKYGRLDKNTWREDLAAGFSECWRVLDNGGTLIFKWNETQIKIREILKCFSEKPIMGQTTTVNLKTHWMVFYKR